MKSQSLTVQRYGQVNFFLPESQTARQTESHTGQTLDVLDGIIFQGHKKCLTIMGVQIMNRLLYLMIGSIDFIPDDLKIKGVNYTIIHCYS